MPKTTLSRVLEGLKRKRVIKILKLSTGAAGGTILRVNKPDDLAELRARRIQRLGQLLDKLSSEKDWQKNPDKKTLWDKLGQELGQLREREKSQKQGDLFTYPQSGGTKFGPVDVSKYINAFKHDKGEEKSKGQRQAVERGADAARELAQNDWTNPHESFSNAVEIIQRLRERMGDESAAKKS